MLVTSSTNGNEISVFYQKFSAQGTFLWAGHSSIFPSPNAYINLRQITADPSGNFYTRGRIRGEADFDLGPDTTRLSSTNSMNNVFINNEYIAKYNTQGEFQWMRQIETDGIDLMDFTLDPDNNILFTGSLTSKGADFDPGPDSLILMSQNIYQEIFLGKWQQESPCSTLSLQIDQSIDATCSPGLVSGFATGGTEPYSYSWNDNSALTDTFLQVFTTGIYELSVTDSIGCSKSVSTLISAPRIITGSYLRVNTTALEFRSGFDAHIWLDAYNDGCVPVDGTLSLQLDPLLYFQGASISPDTIINKTLIWYIDDMIIDSPHVKIRVDVRVSTVARRGDLLCVDTRIIPRNIPTFKSKNNQDNFCLEVVASYDPNDKRSNPQGICEEGYILPDEKITYTVRFQNIGDVDAVNIFILDTLDTDFDIDSLKVVGKSHEPMITEFLPGGVLKFRFDGIHLPDSTTDEPNSHGYVMFEVAPKANRTSGTELINRAGIYFDFNDPVITNTVRNTLIDVLPTQDTTFVQAAGCDSYELNRRSYASSGTYFQHLQGTGSCDSIISLTLTLPNLDSTVSISGGSILQSNQVSDPGSPVSYQWLDCDNNSAPISGATQQQFTPDKNGNYAVMISQEGCSKISACTPVTTVGIDRDFLSSLTYYPNPTSGILHIEMGEPHTSINVKIFSPIGQLLDQIPYGPSEKLSIQLPEQVGVYFVELSVEGKVAMLKVLKR